MNTAAVKVLDKRLRKVERMLGIDGKPRIGFDVVEARGDVIEQAGDEVEEV